jgi:hypothetical protein
MTVVYSDGAQSFLLKKGSKPEELKKLEFTQEIGDCVFINIADTGIDMLAVVQGHRIMLYNAKTLEENPEKPYLDHNPGSEENKV